MNEKKKIDQNQRPKFHFRYATMRNVTRPKFCLLFRMLRVSHIDSIDSVELTQQKKYEKWMLETLHCYCRDTTGDGEMSIEGLETVYCIYVCFCVSVPFSPCHGLVSCAHRYATGIHQRYTFFSMYFFGFGRKRTKVGKIRKCDICVYVYIWQSRVAKTKVVSFRKVLLA